ncbi:MAG: carbohydrate kinase family protein [Nitriliruptoraceae bacterium]
MTRVLVEGELTVDDVIVEDVGCDWKQIGGGALYSAVGAAMWGVEVVLCATIGPDYPLEALDPVAAGGVDISHVTRIEEPSLGLWLLSETGDRRRQIVKSRSATFQTLSAARPPWDELAAGIEGVHAAPTMVAAQSRVLSRAAAHGIVATQDALIEPFIEVERYRTGEAMRGASVFLPSIQEVRQIWGDDVDLPALFDHLHEVSGLRALVVTLGSAGADVYQAAGPVLRVPPVTVDVVDTTGAGDAFCGGFLTGLLATDDPVEAAIRGAVSSSFVVATVGAPAAIRAADPATAMARAAALRDRLEEAHDDRRA